MKAHKLLIATVAIASASGLFLFGNNSAFAAGRVFTDQNSEEEQSSELLQSIGSCEVKLEECLDRADQDREAGRRVCTGGRFTRSKQIAKCLAIVEQKYERNQDRCFDEYLDCNGDASSS